jgi:hypothetical protein
MHISIDNHYLSVLSRTVNSVKEITEGDLAELLFSKAQYLLSLLHFSTSQKLRSEYDTCLFPS